MTHNTTRTPALLNDIHSTPAPLERISSSEWPSSVAGTGDTDQIAAEKHLQDFLIRCPSILPLQNFSSIFHPSVCIGREVSTDAGSIDCLFISGQGRITIVETKLYKNPEARRPVVAQLLDYCDQVSRFSYDQLDKHAKSFANNFYPDYEYSDLRSLVSWLIQKGKHTDEDETDAGWILDDEQFYHQTQNSLRRGEMLGLIVGDRIDRRIISLVEFAKSKPGLALELGLVELAFYKPQGQKSPLIVVPSVIEKAVPIARTVVDVRVDTHGSVQVNVEPASEVSSVKQGSRSPQLASSLQFLDLVKQKHPAILEEMKILLNKMQEVAESSDGVFEVDYMSITANLYWRENEEKRRRIFTLEAKNGKAFAVLGYLKKSGHDQLRMKLEKLVKPVFPETHGKYGYQMDIVNSEVDNLLEFIDSMVDVIVTETGDQ